MVAIIDATSNGLFYPSRSTWKNEGVKLKKLLSSARPCWIIIREHICHGRGTWTYYHWLNLSVVVLIISSRITSCSQYTPVTRFKHHNTYASRRPGPCVPNDKCSISTKLHTSKRCVNLLGYYLSPIILATRWYRRQNHIWNISDNGWYIYIIDISCKSEIIIEYVNLVKGCPTCCAASKNLRKTVAWDSRWLNS